MSAQHPTAKQKIIDEIERLKLEYTSRLDRALPSGRATPTSVATIYDHFLGLQAPYAFWSLPVQLGTWGGILLCISKFCIEQILLSAAHLSSSLAVANRSGEFDGCLAKLLKLWIVRQFLGTAFNIVQQCLALLKTSLRQIHPRQALEAAARMLPTGGQTGACPLQVVDGLPRVTACIEQVSEICEAGALSSNGAALLAEGKRTPAMLQALAKVRPKNRNGEEVVLGP